MIPGELGVDIFSELNRVADFGYRVWVFDKTVDELEKLAVSKGRQKRAASLGIQLVHAKHIGIIPSIGNRFVDDLLLMETDPKRDVIATQDAELKRELKKKGYTLIVLRKKKYLNAIKT